MRIVVTGGTGFVGGHTIRRLMAEHELYCVTRKDGIFPAHSHVHRVEQDLTSLTRELFLPQRMPCFIWHNRDSFVNFQIKPRIFSR